MPDETKCICRNGDCFTIAPGFSQCEKCGAIFVFVSSGNVGRYKRLEDVTEEDAKAFDPLMESDFLAFMQGSTRDA